MVAEKLILGSGCTPPPDLRLRETQRLSDGAIFYIIKNGIRFTGMPAWDIDDHHVWHLVAFIRRLPSLSSDEIQRMARQSKAIGTHNSTGTTQWRKRLLGLIEGHTNA